MVQRIVGTAGPHLTAAASSTTLCAISDVRKGDPLVGDDTREHLTPKTCPMARSKLFPFPPSNGKGGGVTLATVEEVPPTDGTFFVRSRAPSDHAPGAAARTPAAPGGHVARVDACRTAT